jgi:tRNA(fMet)-specific endonuclease VapC
MLDDASAYVLDSDTVSYLLRGDAGAIEGMRIATLRGARIYLCPIVWFEVRRGLLHRDARRQLQVFERFAALLEWRDLDRTFWDDVAGAWATLRRKGRPVQDADLMIAVFAKQLGATVVTHNGSHFAPTGVPVIDWCST